MLPFVCLYCAMGKVDMRKGQSRHGVYYGGLCECVHVCEMCAGSEWGTLVLVQVSG